MRNTKKTVADIAECYAAAAMMMDRGRGPSAALLFNAPGKDILVCANREVSQAAVYEFDPA